MYYKDYNHTILTSVSLLFHFFLTCFSLVSHLLLVVRGFSCNLYNINLLFYLYVQNIN